MTAVSGPEVIHMPKSLVGTGFVKSFMAYTRKRDDKGRIHIADKRAAWAKAWAAKVEDLRKRQEAAAKSCAKADIDAARAAARANEDAARRSIEAWRAFLNFGRSMPRLGLTGRGPDHARRQRLRSHDQPSGHFPHRVTEFVGPSLLFIEVTGASKSIVQASP